MHLRTTRRLVLSLSLWLAGCGSAPAPAPEGPRRDAGPDVPVVLDGAGPEAPSADRAAGAAADSGSPGTPDAPIDAPAGPPDSGEPDATPPADDDVTFFAFGDTQYGGGPGDKNAFQIQALNAAPELTWPRQLGLRSEGRPVGPPRGVIIAGDLTQNGQAGRNPLGEWYTGDAHAIDVNKAYGAALANPRISAELGLFLRDYGLEGDDGLNLFKLRWRVYEGYGNHDFDVLERFSGLYGGQAPAVDIVSIRNQMRRKWPDVRRVAAGNAGHYSWDWGPLHLVQLNLAAADMPASGGAQQPRDPRNALTFLREDLEQEVGASCRPVILIMHYGFDPFSAEARWWDAAQRQALFAALRPYNVAAILHGHVHETRAYSVDGTAGRRYDVFSLGSPYYEGQPTNGGRGHFAVFRFSAGRLDAADVSWQPANPVPGMANNRDLWTGKRVGDLRFQTTTTFPDGWGGWVYSREIPRSCP